MSKSDENDIGSSIPITPVYAVEMESLQDVKCEDVDFVSVSCKLARQFSVDAVGQCLGLQESQVQDALRRVTEHHEDNNKIHLLLIKWRELNGDKASLGALIKQSQSNPQIAGIIEGDLRETLPRKLRCTNEIN